MPNARDLLAAKAHQEVFTVPPDATVQDACRLLRQYRIGCLIVGSRTRIEGIFTERDVINRVVAEDRDASRTMVRDVMTRDVIYVKPERPIEEIEAIMKQERIRHLPVVDENGLLGLLSIGDVLAWHAARDKQTVEYLTGLMYGRH